jgi:predicted outer membrane repeat protein
MALGAGPATITLTTALALPNTRNITINGALSGGARVAISGAGGSGGYLKPTLGTPENAASVQFANVDFGDIGFQATANELALTNVSMTSTRPQSDNLKALLMTGARLTLRSVRIEGFNTTASGNVYGAAVDARTSSQPVAAQVDAADLTVVGCTSQYGPGIFAYDQGYGVYPTVACTRCSFVNNTSVSGVGGAVFLALAQGTFHQSLFTQNSALGGGSGGALGLLSGAASATVTRSYFSGNIASSNGGAIYSSAGTLNVRNSAAVGNMAAGNGGALYLTGAQFVVHSLTALNNTAAAYPGIYLAASSGASNVTNSILYGAASASALYASATGSASVRLTKNIIKGYSNTGSCPSPGLCATGTIDADPQLVQVFEAQADGSPVDTFWVPASGCSPAVNSGDNTGGDAVDMRGAARVVGASVDRGAVEFVPSGANVAPTVTGAPSYSAVAGSALVIAAEAGLLSYACDPNGDPLTASLVSPPSPAGSGAVAVNADGSFTFTPAAGFTGAASFMFSVSDGALSAQGAATINVVAGVAAFRA